MRSFIPLAFSVCILVLPAVSRTAAAATHLQYGDHLLSIVLGAGPGTQAERPIWRANSLLAVPRDIYRRRGSEKANCTLFRRDLGR